MAHDRVLSDEASAAGSFNWEPGSRRFSQDGQLLALSPAPVVTSERAVDVTTWIRRKTNGWLDLQGGNWLFGAEFSLMFLSLSLLTVFAASIFTLEVGINLGRWDWGLPLFVLVGNLMISLPWGLYLHFLGNKAVKESPPVRFNRQRREVAMPRWKGGKELTLPFWNANAGLIAYLVFLGTIVFTLSPFMNEYSSIGRRNTLVMQGVIVLALEVVVVGIYLLIAVRMKRKHAPQLIYEFYPWEKLVAFIETQQNMGPSLMATHTFLTLAIPRSDDPETALASARINVGHETAGLAQWECIRRFMEEGPDACPGPKNDETLAGYKASCRQARKELSLLPWLRKKVGDWFFQRYLAHIITERRIRTLALRSLPEELNAWSEPLPESQWAKPSEALKALNELLTQAYQQGLKFSRMGPLSQWQKGGMATPQHKRGNG